MFIHIFHCFVSENKPKKVKDTRVEVTHSLNENVACRSVGKMPSDKKKLCNFRLKVIMDESTKQWWLMSDSIIEHNDRTVFY